VHPATRITCGDVSQDYTAFLGYHEGMRELQPSSAASCFNMTVKVKRNKSKGRYELRVDRPSSCGKFFSFETSIYSEWIRAINTAAGVFGGHSAIARVKPKGTNASRTLKIYTLPGTPEDALLESWRKEWKGGEGDPHHGAFFHGLTTIDFFALWKTVTNSAGVPLAVSKWTEVDFPLAMVVFGSVPDPDPEGLAGEEFH
jgi:hypothetical protein